MCIDDYDDDTLDEIDELFSYIPSIDTGIDEDKEEETQYEDLDDEQFDIDF
ncbi:MAG: hypothetical protein IAA72_02175 [Spirochaetes bacterium]|uniref:Uncharacterized protein n=1 Tax=Candidatus Ornithospirochaeta stercoravium TaxID=2840897 RepID=A0A9D9IAC1_9SPIO|nr:hypothetical protein [Candidatus Ornithospirochaeta stercoravium]